MEYRIHKKTGASLSLLGLGCMRLPKITPTQDAIDTEAAEKEIDIAYQNGITYFDTAWPYHGGQSEIVVGAALKKYPRNSFYLADKMPAWALETKQDCEALFSKQLEKCQVDYFDFYLLHAIQNSNWEKYKQLNVYDFLAQKKAEGKIHRLGFSFHGDIPLLKTVLAAYDWDFVQIQLNYLDWTTQDAKTQYELVTQAGLQCIIMEPVRGGALADLSPQANDILKQECPHYSIASWAIRYAASLPNVLCVLSGMSNLEQLQDNLSTMKPFISLSKKEQTTLQQALAEYKKASTIPCTGCRYCMPCPAGVEIPTVFKLYNEKYAFSKNKQLLKAAYEPLANGVATQCISCGECLSKCPQSIAIPQKMEKIVSLSTD